MSIIAYCAAASPAAGFSRDPASVFINEIHYDNRGADRNEAVEIAGPAGTDLSGWRLVLYTGATGREYFMQLLAGVVPEQGEGIGTLLVSLPTTSLQNGAPDGLALVDADGDVVQLLSYEGRFQATNGPAAGLQSTDIGVSESGSTDDGQSLQLTGNGRMYQDFAWAGPAPSSYGSRNARQAFLPAGSEQPTDPLAAYYAPALGLEGEALRVALHGIIRGHTRHNYDTVWDILEEADEDPNDATAVIGFYTGRSIPKADRDQGLDTPDFWNREHLWASSHGFRNESQHAFTDAHHVRAADKSTNLDRSNRDFDEGGEPHGECSACVFDDDSWDPGPSRRGDVARALFYMDLRYDGGDGNTPDLVLVDRRTTSDEPHIGRLCTLLDWHEEDVVDGAERRRNDVIFAWQDNRNPFIDHPEWAAELYGASCRR